jgi:hypothetical protein
MKADRIRLQVSQARTLARHALGAGRTAEELTTDLGTLVAESEAFRPETVRRIASELADAATELQAAANGLTVLATRIQERCHG